MFSVDYKYDGPKNGIIRASAAMRKDGNIIIGLPGTRIGLAQIPASEETEPFAPLFDVVKRMPALLSQDPENADKSLVRLVPYCLLHNHSEFSLLDGMSTAKKVARRLDSNEYTPVYALTDHGMVSGLPQFDAAMTQAGLHEISGCEFYAESVDGTTKNNHLILLIKNEVGYNNLCHLFTEAQENFYKHANVTIDMLRKHSEGLVCMTACIGGELPRYILANDQERIERFIEIYRGIFGDDLYLEIQNHGLEKERIVAESMIDLSHRYGLKVVATTDSHYVDKDDAYAHEILLCVATQSQISNPVKRDSAGSEPDENVVEQANASGDTPRSTVVNADTDDSTDIPDTESSDKNEKRVKYRFAFDGDGYHILSASEFYALFGNNPEVITNAFEIMDKCAFHFSKKKIEMPYFEIPDGYTEESYFTQLAYDGFNQRFTGTAHLTDGVYLERLKYEISVIVKMGFVGYFLIVQDFINWAKDHDIGIGPGRGSAAGSLVAYCIGITDVDPIPYGLLFERFLNPERISMPDIDVDIADDCRQDVIDYVANKYGKDHVSRIVTFGTEAPKNACKDVARVLEVPLQKVIPLVDAIPEELHITLDKALSKSPDFAAMYNSDPDLHRVVDIARRIEGVARNASQHACGVVIARNPIVESIPELIMTDKNKNKTYTAAFNMVEIEERGCIKFDFLGLRNVTTLKRASEDIGINYREIPLFDPDVYAYIGTGDTDGIFQIESDGMKQLCRELFSDAKRRSKLCKTKEERDALGLEMYERLTAAISLYRPGPIDSIPQYEEGMRNPANIHYDDPQLEPILRRTYGVIVYQEQVQQICRELAGYSYGRADLIRRAMSKKKTEVMDAEKDVFLRGNKDRYESGKEADYVPGCVANGVPEEHAMIIWDKMAKFAEYAFNKSHSAAYAYISVRTAWLKYYYAPVYWAETMNGVLKKSDKLKHYLSCARKSCKIIPPDINVSDLLLKAEPSTSSIYIGLAGLRDLGANAKEICDERNAHGKYESFSDFLIRLHPGKKALLSLAYAGAFECFGVNRKTVVESVGALVDFGAAANARNSCADFDELNQMYHAEVRKETLPFTTCDEYEMSDLLAYEKQYTGLYLTAHPLDEYAEAIQYTSGIHAIGEYVVSDDDDGEGEASSNVNRSMNASVKKLNKGEKIKTKIVGLIKSAERKITKKGTEMYSGVIEDKDSSIRFVIFANELDDIRNGSDFDLACLREGAVVIASGVVSMDDVSTQLRVDTLSVMPKYVEPPRIAHKFEVDIPMIESLRTTALACHRGNLIVVLRVRLTANRYGNLVIDDESGIMYNTADRDITDTRNLAVDDAGFKALKELAHAAY